MGVAVDNAWQQPLVSGSKLATSVYADATKEALALHIVERAQRGERRRESPA
jgi:hypothetical protein